MKGFILLNDYLRKVDQADAAGRRVIINHKQTKNYDLIERGMVCGIY